MGQESNIEIRLDKIYKNESGDIVFVNCTNITCERSYELTPIENFIRVCGASNVTCTNFEVQGSANVCALNYEISEELFDISVLFGKWLNEWFCLRQITESFKGIEVHVE